MTELKKTVKLLLNSYDTLGVINGYAGTRFPSMKEVTHVLSMIKDLLFPGFTSPEDIHEDTIEHITEQRLYALLAALTKQITFTLKWNKEDTYKERATSVSQEFLNFIPELRELLRLDAEAIYEGDPASVSETEIILSYPGFQAILVHRVAHFLYKKNIPLIPRLMTEIVHSDTGIDIHPGASIGHHFFIDHGTGIVVGETAVIGNHVKLYQGVTLGAFSVSKLENTGKRHPTLKDYVTVYAGSTILGGKTVIGERCVVGGNVWLTESLEPSTKIYLSPEFKQSFKKHQSKKSNA
jgi:serine O-acetyltransferase